MCTFQSPPRAGGLAAFGAWHGGWCQPFPEQKAASEEDKRLPRSCSLSVPGCGSRALLSLKLGETLGLCLLQGPSLPLSLCVLSVPPCTPRSDPCKAHGAQMHSCARGWHRTSPVQTGAAPGVTAAGARCSKHDPAVPAPGTSLWSNHRDVFWRMWCLSPRADGWVQELAAPSDRGSGHKRQRAAVPALACQVLPNNPSVHSSFPRLSTLAFLP